MWDYMTGPWNKGLIQHLYKRFTVRTRFRINTAFSIVTLTGQALDIPQT